MKRILSFKWWFTGSAFCVGFATAVLAVIPDSLLEPIPRENSRSGWLQYQRNRYVLAPVLRQAARLLNQGDFEKARPLLEEARRTDPGSIRIRILLLEAYRQLGLGNEGLSLCDDVLADHPAYPGLRVCKGQLALETGKSELAIQELQSALTSLAADDPRCLKIYPSLTTACLQQKQYAEAERYAAEWLEQEDVLAAREILIECAIRQENWAAALNHLEPAVRLAADARDRGRLFLKQGYLLSGKNELPEARQAFLQARELLAGRSYQNEIYLALGQNAFRQKNFEEAARNLKVCLLDSFSEDTAGYYLAALVNANQWALCALEAEQFLNQRGLSPAFRASTGRSLLGCYKNLADNSACYLTALRLYEESPQTEYLLELAQAADRLNRRDEVMALFEKHLEEYADDQAAKDRYNLLKRKKPGTMAGMPPSGSSSIKP